MSSLKKKGFKAFGWDFVGKLGNQGIGFVISIILARLLSPSDFGLLAMVTVVTGIAGLFSDTGLGSALIQRKEVNDEHYGSVFYFNLVVGFTLAIILFLSSGLIADFYKRPEIKLLSQVMSLTFIINSFGNVRRLWLYKNLNYKIPAQSSFIGVVFGGTTGVIMAFNGWGVWSLVAQSIITGIVANIYLYFATKWKPKLIFSLIALKELWGFGFNMFMAGLIETFSNQLDKLIIGKLFSASSLGFYFRAKSLDSLVTTYSSGSLMSVLFPIMSNIQHDDERFKNLIYKSLNLLSFIIFLLLGINYLCAKDIVLILFSAKWLASVDFYKILVLGGFIYPFSSLLVNIISSKGNSKAFLMLDIYKKVPLALNFIFGFWYGISGFLYGCIISGYIALILNIYFAAKEMKIKDSWFYKIMWKYFVIWIFLCLIYNFIDLYFLINNSYIHLIIYSISYTILYTISNWVLKLEGLLIIKKEFLNLTIIKNINK